MGAECSNNCSTLIEHFEKCVPGGAEALAKARKELEEGTDPTLVARVRRRRKEKETATVVSEEDMIKFHNGDTLDSIPVIRDISAQSSPLVTNRQLWCISLGLALVTGAVTGLVLSQHDGSPAPNRAAAVSPSAVVTTKAPAPVPTVTATATVTTRATVEVPRSYAQPSVEQVYVVRAPATGGDPGTDFCFSYDDSYGTTLLADAPAYLCRDFLFSTHPKDGLGVFEETVPDCSATPGGRAAQINFSAQSGWGPSTLYTCLLRNDGA